MTRIFIESLTSGYLLSSSDGGGFEISPIAAVSNAHDLIRWLADHEGVNLDDLRPTGEPNFKQPTLVFDKPDCAGEPESIGEIAERVVRKAGGDKKPIVPDVRDDERPVAVAVSCKPDGSDLKQNLMRETIKKPLTEAQKKVLYFLQAAIAKHGNHGIQFDYAKVAEKTMHTENYVKGCITTLGLRGDLVLDVRAKGHAPFISLPVPEKKK